MKRNRTGKVTVLAGGVGAARLLRGLVELVPASSLSVIVNTGDDDVFHGLHVCPDIDTILYTLSGLSDPDRGWGIAGDGFHAMDQLAGYGAETWFRLGDRDLATHLFRTEELRTGKTLSQITAAQARALGVSVRVLPMTDVPVRTVIEAPQGRLSFQEYLVRERGRPAVRAIHYEGVRSARPAPGVLKAIGEAGLVVIAPSNPFVSIGPILAVPGVRSAVRRATAPVVAVSPLIGGRPVKGPADRMMRGLGMKPSALALAELYRDLLDALVIDAADRSAIGPLETTGLRVAAVPTLMSTPARSIAVARHVLGIGASVRAALAS
ncbi:MAG: 2-phospho-L-lactate transferase [Deltaproteobacteria bacterium]|nr:2-phospho-L-lactate transferase [Deltaproteobacteria bacterium]